MPYLLLHNPPCRVAPQLPHVPPATRPHTQRLTYKTNHTPIGPHPTHTPPPKKPPTTRRAFRSMARLATSTCNQYTYLYSSCLLLDPSYRKRVRRLGELPELLEEVEMRTDLGHGASSAAFSFVGPGYLDRSWFAPLVIWLDDSIELPALYFSPFSGWAAHCTLKDTSSVRSA